MCKKSCPVCGRETGNHDAVCKSCGAQLHDPAFREANSKATHHSTEREPLRQQPVTTTNAAQGS